VDWTLDTGLDTGEYLPYHYTPATGYLRVARGLYHPPSPALSGPFCAALCNCNCNCNCGAVRCGACVRYVRCSYDGTSVCAVVVLPRYCSCSAAPLSHGCAGGEEKEEGRMTAKGEAVHFPIVLSFHYSSAQRPMRQWLSTVLGYGYGPSRCG
jgi:hypothetical protein